MGTVFVNLAVFIIEKTTNIKNHNYIITNTQKFNLLKLKAIDVIVVVVSVDVVVILDVVVVDVVVVEVTVVDVVVVDVVIATRFFLRHFDIKSNNFLTGNDFLECLEYF